jgi:hypothetical protein
MLNIQIEKDTIENAFNENKQVAHYCTQAILARCAKVAGIII